MIVKDEIEQDMFFLNLEIEAIEAKIEELSKSYEDNKSLLSVLNIAATRKTLSYLDYKIKLERMVLNG
jgi:hypothetical protein